MMSQSRWLTGHTIRNNSKEQTLSYSRSFTKIATTSDTIFLSNLRLQSVLTYLLYFFRQKMQQHALSRKPFIVVIDLLTHAWDGSTCVRVLASIPNPFEISRGDDCLSSLATRQNHLFLILVLSRSVFLCWWHRIIGPQPNTVDCFSWLSLFQWCNFSIRNITILSGYIDLNDSSLGFWDWS
jgi:hypothetical protein